MTSPFTRAHSEDSISALHIEKVELHGITTVHVRVREEELASKEKLLVLADALFSESLGVVEPEKILVRVQLLTEFRHLLLILPQESVVERLLGLLRCLGLRCPRSLFSAQLEEGEEERNLRLRVDAFLPFPLASSLTREYSS